MVRLLIIAIALAAVGLGWYYYVQPWWALERLAWAARDPTSPELSRSADALAALGPRALPQIIDRIGTHSIWGKRAGVLPAVLTRMGEPGRRALLTAIDRERDPERRMHYVAALIQAYDDFSRVNYWIDFLVSNPRYFPSALEQEFTRRFGEEVPHVRSDAGINPEFLRWYDQRTTPKGPFPPRTRL